MKEIVESYFAHRSMVNHQLASYDDCIPIGDGKGSRMESIVRGIRIGSDEDLEDVPGGKEAGGSPTQPARPEISQLRRKGTPLPYWVAPALARLRPSAPGLSKL